MQMKTKPERLSPLHNKHQSLDAHFVNVAGWQVAEVFSSSADEMAALRDKIGLVDNSPNGKLSLKGLEVGSVVSALYGEAPKQVGEVIEIKSSSLLVGQLSPDEFLILTPPQSGKEIAASLGEEIASRKVFVSLSDQTSGLVGLAILGPKCGQVMSKLCAIPFEPAAFPNLHAAQSSFAKVRATIFRHDRDQLPVFELYADRSYADYLWDTILDAGGEFGIQPVGWKSYPGSMR